MPLVARQIFYAVSISDEMDIQIVRSDSACTGLALTGLQIRGDWIDRAAGKGVRRSDARKNCSDGQTCCVATRQVDWCRRLRLMDLRIGLPDQARIICTALNLHWRSVSRHKLGRRPFRLAFEGRHARA